MLQNIPSEMTSRDVIEFKLQPFYIPAISGYFDYFYGSIPESELFRLFVDVSKQKQEEECGFVGYEKREPGCLKNLYSAFQYIQSTSSEPLTSDYIREVHRLAASHCTIANYKPSGWSSYYIESINAGTYKDCEFGSITMSLRNVTQAGYESMMTGMRVKSLYLQENGMVVVDLGYPENGYEFEVNQLLEKYHLDSQVETPYEKLESIVQLIQGLEHLHPFKDGNLRTFVTLLMNRELVKHGLYPSLMEDPNNIDGHSVTEVMVQVIQGMENFYKLKEEGTIPDTIPTKHILDQGYTNPIQEVHRYPRPK